jgi:uroporphyrinogen-III synthase
LPETLDADVVVLYRTVPLAAPAWPPCDVVILASGSAARSYAALRRATPAVSIGPETTRVAGEIGLAIVAEAATPDVAGLVEAVRRALGTP